MHGVSDGTWMAVALLLTSPFWVLFCLWPCLWLRDRLRAKRLWADSVGVVLAEAPRAGASSSTDDTADIAIPIVIGRSGVLVPMVGWLAAFPSLDEAYLRTKGIRLTPADALPGVHIDGVMRDELLRGIAHIALTADAASLHHSSKGIVNDDLEAADHCCFAADFKRILLRGEDSYWQCLLLCSKRSFTQNRLRNSISKPMMLVFVMPLFVFSKCFFTSSAHGWEDNDGEQER